MSLRDKMKEISPGVWVPDTDAPNQLAASSYQPSKMQYSNTASDANLANYKSQEAESQRLAAGGAERASWQQQTNLNQNQLANKLAQQNIDAVTRSQQFNPENTQNLGYKGDLNNYGDFSRSAILESPKTPTSTNPMIPVTATGANTPVTNNVTPISGSTVAPTPIINIGNTGNNGPTSTMIPSGGQNVSEMQSGGYDISGMTAQDYMNMSPEEQRYIQQQKTAQGMQGVGQFYQQGLDQYQKKIDEVAAQKEAARQAAMAKTETAVSEYQAKMDAAKAKQLADLERQYASSVDRTQQNLSFQGFGRSTAAADAVGDIEARKAADIADLNSRFSEDVATYKAKLLENVDKSLEKYDVDIKEIRGEKSKLEAQKMQTQGDLIKEMIKNDPTDPVNVMNNFEKMMKIKLDYANFNRDVKKDAQDSASKILDAATKYGYVPELSDADMLNMSSSLGIPASKIPDVINKAVEKAQAEKTSYQMSSDGQGGMYIFDPKGGKAVGRYDFMGNYTSLDGSNHPPIAPNTPNTSINAKNVASTILGGKITQPYGVKVNYEKNGKHNGLDYVPAGGKGAPVQSFANGTVIKVEKYNGDPKTMPYGNSVIIKTADGKEIRMSHLDNINVQQGQQINAGDTVGGLGTTGHSTGLHVDLRIKENGAYINPAVYLTSLSKSNPQASTSSATPSAGPITMQTAQQEATKRNLTGADARNFIQASVQAGFYPEDEKAAEKTAKQKTQDLTTINQLTNQFEGVSKEVRTLDQGFAVTKGFDVNTKNPYDDQALIFSFMKVLDPGSVVREGEFKTAQNNSSLLNSIGANWQNAATGTGMLLPEQRQKILDTMKKLHETKLNDYSNIINGYADRAKKLGIEDPSLVMDYTPDYFTKAKAEQAQPSGYLSGLSSYFGLGNSGATQMVSVKGPDGTIYQMTPEDAQLAVQQEGGTIIK